VGKRGGEKFGNPYKQEGGKNNLRYKFGIRPKEFWIVKYKIYTWRIPGPGYTNTYRRVGEAGGGGKRNNRWDNT
jgi:hypothetical protein